MYLPIDQLINKCGSQSIVELLPKLFIDINTASAEEKTALIDSDYNNFKLNSPLISLLDTNINTNTNKNINNNKGLSQQYLQEHYNDINTIISLFFNSKDELDIDSFDYIVFSYLGDFIVRYKNQYTANQPIGKSLYLDIQSVRIALVDEYTEKTWNKYYVFFNKGIKYVGGLFVLGFAFRFFHQNIFNGFNGFNIFNGYNNRRMIGL
jgi:hypothetical protein